MAWIQKERPDVTPQKKAAFANSVGYLVTGASGGYGGPSLREHIAGMVHGAGGQHSFEEACRLLLKDDGAIFGSLTEQHHCFWNEQSDICFDDDPDDLRQLSGKK